MFLTAFGTDFLISYGHRILFAIAIHSTECWLLPLYYKSIKDKSETKNCYEKLNKQVHGLKKEYKIYEAISSAFCSNKKLEKAFLDNPSFKIFIENELRIKVPLTIDEDNTLSV